MTSSYEEIYSCFLSKITEPDFVNLPEETVRELMHDWMFSTVANPYVKTLFSSIEFDDLKEIVRFELVYSTDDISDIELVKDIIARSMVIAWLEPKVKSVANINQMFGGREQKFYSQASHLKEIKELLCQEQIPEVLNKPTCKKCAYYEYCYI